MKHRNLKRAVDKRHLASEKLIKLWESISKLRCLMALREHDLRIIITDYLVSPDELKETKDYHKVCLWSKN